jgi:hypothetical protein
LALSIGDFALLDAEGDGLAYERRYGADRLIAGGHDDPRLLLGTNPARFQGV